jgi:putative addiction module component (TIGR02574 family)
MTPENEAIGRPALSLPEPERTESADRLLESLLPEEASLTDDELFAELERRRAEVEQGSVKPIPWSHVRFEE